MKGDFSMVKLYDGGVYLVNGREIVTDAAALPSKCGRTVTKEEAEQGTIAYGILKAHNKSGDMQNLRMRFDSLTSHDITYVGIIQTAHRLLWQLVSTYGIGNSFMPEARAV